MLMNVKCGNKVSRVSFLSLVFISGNQFLTLFNVVAVGVVAAVVIVVVGCDSVVVAAIFGGTQSLLA
jgi:hypothetical protein